MPESSSVPARDPIVGIDLGTTNSLVAVMGLPLAGEAAGVGGAAVTMTPRILADEDGKDIVPSVVRFELDGRVVVGRDARDQAVRHPRTTVYSAKRLMGRSRADAERRGDLKHLAYEVIEGGTGGQTARVALPAEVLGGGRGGKWAEGVSPQEISAMILRRLKEIASSRLGVEVRRAVVTVPAYFDDAQRQATRDAGRLAGLDVVRIVNEPTAAALAYGIGLRKTGKQAAQNIVVYDLGGGTFDVSILRVVPAEDLGDGSGGAGGTGGADAFQVISTAGDTHLGGDDMDAALVDLFTREIAEQFGLGGTEDVYPPETRQSLRLFAEQCKIRLSEGESASIRIEVGGKDQVYQRTVTREEYERLISPLVERTIECCDRALRDAARELEGESISAVVLVGGATRTPLVRRRVAERFGAEPYVALDPDRVVALGAAVQAAVLAGESQGMGKSDRGGNTSALLLDVIPLSLGIETVGGAFAKLIIRNSPVPTRASERFSTSVDGQTAIKIHVLQGEREMAADCRSLGVFTLGGLPPMPAGIPRLKVEFFVDVSGILSVHAIEERSGKRAAVQIVPTHGLTRDEVDRIERESLTHARDDMTRHRVVDLIANCKLDLKWTGKQLEKMTGKLEAKYEADLRGMLARLKLMVDKAEADWKSVDANTFHQLKEDFDKASVRLHEQSIAESLKGDTAS